MNLGYLKNIHSYVARADLRYYELGRIRTDEVFISGTAWRPEIPNTEVLHKEMMQIMSMENTTEKAICLMLWIMRNQIFKDGNKRVATIAANKVLIENGNGILAVPVELDGTFKKMLVDYYKSNNDIEIKAFLYDNCLNGIDRI